MKDNLTYGAPIIFRTPFWVELPSDPEVRLQLLPLSYRDYITIQELQYLISKYPNIQSYDNTKELIAKSIITIDNATGFSNNLQFVEQLPGDDIEFLFKQLFNLSVITEEQVTNLNSLFDIFFDEKLQDDNWDCETCIHKKLQGFRACAFIPEEERDENYDTSFTYKVNNKLYTQCPKSIMDHFVINQACAGYAALKAGILPEVGGMGDQTTWFVRASSIMLSRFNQIEAQNKIM